MEADSRSGASSGAVRMKSRCTLHVRPPSHILSAYEVKVRARRSRTRSSAPPLRPSARRTRTRWAKPGSIPSTALPASSRARSTRTFSLRSSSWLWTPFGALPDDARCFGLQSILEAKQLLRVFRVQINRPQMQWRSLRAR